MLFQGDLRSMSLLHATTSFTVASLHFCHLLVSGVHQECFVQAQVRQVAVLEALFQQGVDDYELLLLFALIGACVSNAPGVERRYSNFKLFTL